MRIELQIVLDIRDIERYIPYELLYSSWDILHTFSGKMAMASAGLTFEELKPFYTLSYKYCKYGKPREMHLTIEQFDVWKKIRRMFFILYL